MSTNKEIITKTNLDLNSILSIAKGLPTYIEPTLPEGKYIWKRGKLNTESILPEGYTQLEYIESTGTQYIDTKVTHTSNLSVELDYQVTEYVNDNWFFSALNISNGVGWRAGTFENAFYLVDITASQTEDLLIRTTFTGTTTQSSGLNMFLFAENRNGAAYGNSKGRNYGCKMYDSSGTLIRNYIPCINPENSISLYDLVTNEFYPNSGTGVFIAGAMSLTDIEYIAGNDESAYPTNGELDGYYYEQIVNPVDLSKETDLISTNIRKDINIFGVVGSMVEGITGVDYGSITLLSSNNTVTVNHKLGTIPKYVALISTVGNISSLTGATSAIMGVPNSQVWIYYGASYEIASTYGSNYATATDSTITFNAQSSDKGFVYDNYYWIAIA